MNLVGINFYLSLIFSTVFAFLKSSDVAITVLIWLVSFVVAYLALTLIAWIFIIAVSLLSGKEPKNGKLSTFHGFLMNLAISTIASYARIKITVKGKDKLPLDPYLLVCNHRSNFDNFVITSAIRNPYLVFISKPENFKIPFVGRMMRRCGYLAIDRENPRAALKTIHKSAEMIKESGAFVGVFPEGTRGSGEGVAEFSEGCFLVAKKADCPVVVCALHGTERIHKRFPRSTKVTLEFIDVIAPDKIKELRSGEISEIAHTLIEQSLTDNGKDKT